MHFTSRTFWEGMVERAISTFAQALLGSFGVGTTLLGLDWKGALGIAGASALASILKSFATPAETDRAVATGLPEDPYTPRHAG